MHLKSILSAALLSAAFLQAGSVAAATFSFEFSGNAGGLEPDYGPATVTGTFSLPDVMIGTDLVATDMLITGFGNATLDAAYSYTLPAGIAISSFNSQANAFTLVAGEIVSASYSGSFAGRDPYLALSSGTAFAGNLVCDYGNTFMCIGGPSTSVTFSKVGAVASVPLPAGGLMLLAGLGGLAAARRVQKARS